MPRMPLSGVRNSCVSVANNVVLARSASSAARTWRVMSRATDEMRAVRQHALDPFEAAAIRRRRFEAALAVFELRRRPPCPRAGAAGRPNGGSWRETPDWRAKAAVRRQDCDGIGQCVERIERMRGGGLPPCPDQARAPVKKP